MKLEEAALLSRTNARFYAGQLGEDKFDAHVAPHIRSKVIGSRRYYVRADIDRWLGLDPSTADPQVSRETILDRL